MKWLLSFVVAIVAYRFIKIFSPRMTAEGRHEETEKMQQNNSRPKHTRNWTEIADARELVKTVLSRVTEKLHVVRIQEPEVLVGVEEDMGWIQRELMETQVKYSYSPEELLDVVYDFEDIIDDLILRSVTKKIEVGNRKWCLLLIRIHKKLGLIKSNILALPRRLPTRELQSASPMNEHSIEEIVWSDTCLINIQGVANTILSPVEEKAAALLAQGDVIQPHTKKKVMRVLEKLRSLNGFLKGLASVELDDCGMVWMEEISHVCLSTVISIDDFIHGTQGLKGFLSAFGRLKPQHKLAAQMDKMYAMIQSLSIHRPPAVNQQVHSTNLMSATGSSVRIRPQTTMREPDIASFGDDVQAIISRLLVGDESFRVIPILGMEGMGKTTLAKLVFNHEAVMQHFTFALWTLNGCQFHLRHEDRMMEYNMSEAGDGWSYDEKMQRLTAYFISNRCFIVLDDSYFPYQMLQVLQGTLNGSRMIMTSCKMNVRMKSDPHPLRLRTDEESWALFTHALNVSIPPELLKLKDEIPKRCWGLPLLIEKLAEQLSHRAATIEEWSTVLQQFSREQRQLWPHTLCNIHNDLSLYMRRCLFYFTLFPQDLDIPARRLIALWVAEDLIQPESDHETPEDVAERCLNLLIARGMVQLTKKKLNGNVKMLRLPDVFRQYWLSKAQQATFHGVRTSTRSELSLGTNKIRRLVDHLDKEDLSFDHIHGDKSMPSTSLTPYYEDALSFLSFDTRKESKPGEEVGNFLHCGISNGCFLMLLVLDLENIFRPKLPEAIGKLAQLRYLGLRSTFLEMVPSSISKLQNLRTLDMKHTSINSLPNSIWKLQQLRHLYLTETCRSKLMLQHGANFPTVLQTLCGLFVNEETPLRDGLDGLLSIRKLGLTLSSKQGIISLKLQEVVDWVLKLNQLRSLRLKSISENNQPWELELKPLVSLVNLSYIYLLGKLRNPCIMSKFPYSLVDLTLSGSELVEDPMQSLDKLSNLRSLKLLAKSYLGKKMLCSQGGFPQLRVLKLWKLEQLEEWDVEKGALAAIRDLDIRSCTSLKMLPAELRHRTLLKIEVLPPLM